MAASPSPTAPVAPPRNKGGRPRIWEEGDCDQVKARTTKRIHATLKRAAKAAGKTLSDYLIACALAAATAAPAVAIAVSEARPPTIEVQHAQEAQPQGPPLVSQQQARTPEPSATLQAAPVAVLWPPAPTLSPSASPMVGAVDGFSGPLSGGAREAQLPGRLQESAAPSPRLPEPSQAQPLTPEKEQPPVTTPKPSPDLWKPITNALKDRVSDQNFEMWLSEVRFVGLSGKAVLLQAPSAFLQEYLTQYYKADIETELRKRYQLPCEAVFVLKNEKAPPPTKSERERLESQVPEGVRKQDTRLQGLLREARSIRALDPPLRDCENAERMGELEQAYLQRLRELRDAKGDAPRQPWQKRVSQ